MKGKAQELAELEAKLENLKSRRPEHGHGTDGYVGERSLAAQRFVHTTSGRPSAARGRSHLARPASTVSP